MKWKKFCIVLVTVIGVLGGRAYPAIVNLDLEFNYTAQYMWSFDRILQQLTIIETLDILVLNALDLRGLTDSDNSTLSVTRIITNNTGVAWGGLVFFYRDYSPPAGYPMSESWMELTELSKLQTIVSQDVYRFESTEPDRVLDGETFTIQFDAHIDESYSRSFHDLSYYYMTAVPEPATVALLGLGGLALLRNLRPVKGQRKR